MNFIKNYFKERYLLRKVRPIFEQFFEQVGEHFNDVSYSAYFEVENNMVWGKIKIYSDLDGYEIHKRMNKMDEEWYLNLDDKYMRYFNYNIV